jgi:hypothetical protein
MGLNLRTSSERIKVPSKKDQERNFWIERGNPRIAKNGLISTDFLSGKFDKHRAQRNGHLIGVVCNG